MVARSPRLLAAARELVPLQQGDLDKFCGLYAIINAVRLALHGQHAFKRVELEHLLVHGLRHLARGRALLPVAAHGIGEAAWLRLCDSILAEVEEMTGYRIARVMLLHRLRKPDVNRALSRMGSKLRRGHPVILTLWGMLDHSSVAVALTDKSLQLFDSSSVSRVRLSSLGMGVASQKRHYLSRRGVAALVFRRMPAKAHP